MSALIVPARFINQLAGVRVSPYMITPILLRIQAPRRHGHGGFMEILLSWMTRRWTTAFVKFDHASECIVLHFGTLELSGREQAKSVVVRELASNLNEFGKETMA